MNVRTQLASAIVLCTALGVSNAVMAGCPTPVTLPGPAAGNSITFGDAISYSLPALGLSVQSSPGQIDDCIVIATGSSGTPVTTNFAGMDNAYSTPTGTNSNPYFRTGDPTNSPDPGQVAPFVGDTPTTWDARLSALDAFLAGNDLVFYFNHNQTNSGDAVDQDLFVWAQIRLHDDANVLPDLFFYVTSVPNTTGLSNFGQPGGDPLAYTGPQTPATCTYPTGSDAACTFPKGGVGTGTGSGDASFMVRARGQICTDGTQIVSCASPTATTTLNHNLGANEAANAVVFPELNTILNAVNFNGYDVMQADIRMGCNAVMVTGGVCAPGSVLNNGYEQIFIGQLVTTPGPPSGGVPEPATLALVGVALLGAAMGRRRKSR